MFHDLGLCPACERGTNELHTGDCPLAVEQDHLDGDHSGCDHGRLDLDRDRAIEARYGGRILRMLTVDPQFDHLTEAKRLFIAESLAI